MVETAFRLEPSAPYRLDLTCWALRRRRQNRLDLWDGRCRRTLVIDGLPIAVEVEQRGDPDRPVLEVTAQSAVPLSEDRLAELDQQVRMLLGVDVDLAAFYRLTAGDARLREMRDRHLGLRPTRFPTLFEALANAVANQQLSLEVGIELLNRLCEAFGDRSPVDGLLAFPEAATIASAAPVELRRLGFSEGKSAYLVGLAGAVEAGVIDPKELETSERHAATAELMSLRGIGRWSAEYVLLRGVGRLEVYPGDDVGARHKIQGLFGLASPPDYDMIAALLERWRPFAGVIYFHLLLEGLSRKGDLGVTDVE